MHLSTLKIKLFWLKAPALYYALFPLLATLFLLASAWPLLFLPLLLWKQPLGRALMATTLFLLTLVYIQQGTYFPPSETQGKFLLSISSIQPTTQSFKTGFLYRGRLKEIHLADGRSYHSHLPLSFSFTEALSPERDYWVQGTLYTKNGYYYSLRIEGKPEQGLKKKLSLVRPRETCRQWFREYIHRYYPGILSAPFLVALTTGVSEDFLLKAHLTQIGCAHLLAISGFHFGLIAGFFHFILRPFFPYRLHYLLLIALLFCYLLFLGKSASICRAFICATCFFFAPLVERRSTAINTLGVALLVCLLLDPLMALEVGFQLSFLATASILLLYPPLKKLFVHKQYGRCRSFLAKTLALNVAVHTALIPLTLLYFHQIQLHSIFYNLFFPSLTAFTLISFFSAMLIHLPLPFLAKLLHLLNQQVTEFFLNFAENRSIYEKTLFIEHLSPWIVVLLFIAFYLCSLMVTEGERM